MRLLRLLVIVGMSLALWLAWRWAPELLTPENMRYLGGVFALTWGLALLVGQRCAGLSAEPGLNGRERERLAGKLAQIRRRTWWVGSVGLFCSVAIWLLGSLPADTLGAIAPLSIGVLVGIGVSHLMVFPGWLNEIDGFVDRVRLREESRRKTDDVLKRITDNRIRL